MAEIHVEQKRRGGLGWLWLVLLLLLAGAAYWFWANSEDTEVTVPAAAGTSSARELPRPMLAWTPAGTRTVSMTFTGGDA